MGFVVGSVAVEELSLRVGPMLDFPTSVTSQHCSTLTGRNVSNWQGLVSFFLLLFFTHLMPSGKYTYHLREH